MAGKTVTTSLPRAGRTLDASHALSLALAVLVGSFGLPARGEERIERPARIIDGDTIEVSGIPIRLFGIDAPEKDQLCATAEGVAYARGMVVSSALAGRIGSGAVSCRSRTTDRYHRVVAVCYGEQGDDLGAWLVENGFVVASCRYSTVYVEQENGARDARQGLWIGQFVKPAEWRTLHHPTHP
jgi:endonuclease YncB( thermonuclease family)